MNFTVLEEPHKETYSLERQLPGHALYPMPDDILLIR